MTELKTNSHQSKGQCSVCKKINHTSIWKVFLEDGWFRGDDVYLGKFCKECKKNKKNIEDAVEAKGGV